MNKKQSIDLNGKTILVTGSPGFIGAHLVKALLLRMSSGTVISFDSMNDYYDPALKEYRLRKIEETPGIDGDDTSTAVRHIFIKGDITDKLLVDQTFSEYRPDLVVHLAAQAGVRYSIDHPDTYITSNIIGFFNILEACRHSYDNGANGVSHLVFASSSSVYGNNAAIPFRTEEKADEPVSLYAATKKSAELLAHSYSKLFGIPCTGLRFFTVYGPAGRPDMFYYSAVEKLLRGEKIRIFNYGNCQRDFTYIDDIVEGVLRVIQGAPIKTTGPDGLLNPPFALYNIGSGAPVDLMDFIRTLQEEMVGAGLLPSDHDFEAYHELVPMQPGDVAVTYADTESLERDYGYRPQTDIREGLHAFIEWYRAY